MELGLRWKKIEHNITIISFHFLLSSMISFPRLFVAIMSTTVVGAQPQGNINSDLLVNIGMHYPNKSSVSYGINGQPYFSLKVTMSESCATYNCTSSCPEDPVWYYDWNKIWGKSRCGYYHDHHEDSDRFVFRRCSDASCAAYVAGQSLIQIAGYSYDNGLNPYSGIFVQIIYATMY
jgi:hypothetical protein